MKRRLRSSTHCHSAKSLLEPEPTLVSEESASDIELYAPTDEEDGDDREPLAAQLLPTTQKRKGRPTLEQSKTKLSLKPAQVALAIGCLSSQAKRPQIFASNLPDQLQVPVREPVKRAKRAVMSVADPLPIYSLLVNPEQAWSVKQYKAWTLPFFSNCHISIELMRMRQMKRKSKMLLRNSLNVRVINRNMVEILDHACLVDMICQTAHELGLEAQDVVVGTISITFSHKNEQKRSCVTTQRFCVSHDFVQQHLHTAAETSPLAMRKIALVDADHHLDSKSTEACGFSVGDVVLLDYSGCPPWIVDRINPKGEAGIPFVTVRLRQHVIDREDRVNFIDWQPLDALLLCSTQQMRDRELRLGAMVFSQTKESWKLGWLHSLPDPFSSSVDIKFNEQEEEGKETRPVTFVTLGSCLVTPDWSNYESVLCNTRPSLRGKRLRATRPRFTPFGVQFDLCQEGMTFKVASVLHYELQAAPETEDPAVREAIEQRLDASLARNTYTLESNELSPQRRRGRRGRPRSRAHEWEVLPEEARGQDGMGNTTFLSSDLKGPELGAVVRLPHSADLYVIMHKEMDLATKRTHIQATPDGLHCRELSEMDYTRATVVLPFAQRKLTPGAPGYIRTKCRKIEFVHVEDEIEEWFGFAPDWKREEKRRAKKHWVFPVLAGAKVRCLHYPDREFSAAFAPGTVLLPRVAEPLRYLLTDLADKSKQYEVDSISVYPIDHDWFLRSTEQEEAASSSSSSSSTTTSSLLTHPAAAAVAASATTAVDKQDMRPGCLACTEKAKLYVFVPCGHTYYCRACLDRMNPEKCTHCQEPICMTIPCHID